MSDDEMPTQKQLWDMLKQQQKDFSDQQKNFKDFQDYVAANMVP